MLFALIPPSNEIAMCPGHASPRLQTFDVKGNRDRL